MPPLARHPCLSQRKTQRHFFPFGIHAEQWTSVRGLTMCCERNRGGVGRAFRGRVRVRVRRLPDTVSTFRDDRLLSNRIEVQIPWWPHAKSRGWYNLVSGGRGEEEGYFDREHGAQLSLSIDTETSQGKEGRLVFLPFILKV